jgi:outer membrane receptor protein involved in Fe transport
MCLSDNELCIANDNLMLRLFVNNVTDEDYPLNIGNTNYFTQNANPAIPPAQAGSWNLVPRRPREVGLSLSYDF